MSANRDRRVADQHAAAPARRALARGRCPRARPSNADVVRALREMALFLEMDDVPFKPQAYEKAAYAVTALDQPLAELYARGGVAALDAVPGIGKGIAERIAVLLDTGSMPDLEELRKQTPIDVLSLTAVEGIGAKRARSLWETLQVQSVDDLERAARAGRIRTAPHFGARSEKKILEAIAFYRDAGGRRLLGDVLGIAQRLEGQLARVPGVDHVVVAGSIRRHRETIGDVDLLVAATDAARVSRAFESLPEVEQVLAHGPTKTLVRLSNGMDADLRVIAPEGFGAALLYFTGSQAHNVALRRVAQKLGLKLNEYGLFRGSERIAGRTEAEVFAALGLPFIPPELREDEGEIELARRGELPSLIEAREIRGDLQVHTTWSDGAASIEAMARAARALGRQYLVITDHTRDLAMTGGLDEDGVRAQLEEIRAVNRSLGGIRVLAGAEVNIRPDGSLDLSDDVLAELDVVGAAVHSHFEQSREEITARLLRAVSHPHVDVLFHPLARALGRRRAVQVDFPALLEACRRSGTVLELDAQPGRLDLPDAQVREAIRHGLRIAIDSDAHTPDELGYIETFGVGVARRAGAERQHVINALPLEQMLSALKGRAG